MFKEIVDRIGLEVSGRLAFQELLALHSIDRWFDFKAFQKSSSHLAARWERFGLKRVEVENFPADGRTKVGSWIMPFAWDASEALLTVEEPARAAGAVIARYSETPTCLAQWSAPTPKAGVTADLVRIEDAADEKSYAGRNVADRIVLTSTRPVFMKGLAAAKGALGVVSDFVPHPLDLPDENFWMNAWSDNPGGWGLHAGESRIFGFNISPRKGRWLRNLIREHGGVKVKAVVDTRFRNGEIPAVTAVIPGARRDEEVLLLGHAFEQGANDNASGVAVMLEAARALSLLISEGRLPKPRRSIRFLAVSECYSTFAYCQKHADRMASTLAALCVDSVGQKQDLCRTGLGIHNPPHSNASFISAYCERLAQGIFDPWRPNYLWKMLPYSTTDNVITDPMIGPATMLLSSFPSDLYWHTSGDTAQKVDVEALGKIAHFAASYLYTIANAGAIHALYFAALATARAKARLSEITAGVLEQCTCARPDFPAARRRILHVADVGMNEVHSVRSILSLREAKSIESELSSMSGEVHATGERNVAQLENALPGCGISLAGPPVPRREKELFARAQKLIPIRKYAGTMAYDSVDVDKLAKHPDPRWNGAVTAALFWCDGKRTLAEVLQLAGSEIGRDLTGLVPEFEFMAEEGLIGMKEAG